MSKFAIERFGELKGEIHFYKLFINGECQINDFEKQLQKNSTYYSQVKTIKAYMDSYSNGQRLPKTKYKILKQNKSDCVCFEFRSNDLRYYGFMFPNTNNMIMCCAAKNDKSEQDKDILRMINTQKEYLSSLPGKNKLLGYGKK